MKYTGFRAVVIIGEKIVIMERRKDRRHYFVLPGGHLEKNETYEECVAREVYEEFGIKVEPIKLIYNIIDVKTCQGIFVCKYLEGTPGRTTFGEEYQPDRNRGEYNPITIDLDKLPTIRLVPRELKIQLIDDLKKYGKNLDRPLIDIIANAL